MNVELISKRTRNELRELLVGWTLHRIAMEFEAAGISCDRDYIPPESGQRRSFVEQHYHTLDFTDAKDVRRLVSVLEGVLRKAEQEVPAAFNKSAAKDAIAELIACLRRDGLKYVDGHITPVTPDARRIFDDTASDRTVTEVTRKNILDEIKESQIQFAGRQTDREFLARLYDLDALPSLDTRFTTFRDDISQHCENNQDWSSHWAFDDPRLDLLHTSDHAFLQFLCEMVHPIVRPDQQEVDVLVAIFNKYLAADCWQIAAMRKTSGKPIYGPRRQSAVGVNIGAAPHALDVLSDAYVQELVEKCDDRIRRGDFDGAITSGRTMLEATLGELQLRLTGARDDYKGDLPKLFRQVAKLLRMDDERSDLDDRFKDVIRGLVTVVHALASLRNKISDGHPRVRRPPAHHARLVVNAAKTVSSFLVESYAFQRNKGVLAAKASTSMRS